jgi:hypothetical protein
MAMFLGPVSGVERISLQEDLPYNFMMFIIPVGFCLVVRYYKWEKKILSSHLDASSW